MGAVIAGNKRNVIRVRKDPIGRLRGDCDSAQQPIILIIQSEWNVSIKILPSCHKPSLAFKRGTLGGSEYHNTAEKFAKYRNIAKKKTKSPNTTILRYRVETWCHTETASLYIKFRANNTETEINIGNVRFRQNKQNK